MISVMVSPSRAVLQRAAFGDDPGGRLLPCARTREDSWLRAVALGGQGRYAAARAELDRIDAGPDQFESLALSTRASLLRQLGWHACARGLDGRALAIANAGPNGPDVVSGADALIGLAADALGLARFDLAEVLLKRAGPLVAVADSQIPWRLSLRLAWVRAELAMVAGRGEQSLRHARAAQQMAAQVPSVRHRVKTSMVLAAALSSVGQYDECAVVACDALDAAAVNALVPLRWALAAMLAGLPAPQSIVARREEFDAIHRECARWVQRAGGRWRAGVLTG